MKMLRGQSSSAVPESKGQQGFTLLEVVIAMVLMLIVTLGAASLFAYAINYNSGANDRMLAHAVAQQQMERMRRTSFTGVVTPAQPEPVITRGGRSYRVVTTVCIDAACGGSLTLKKITVEVTPEVAGAGWARIPVRIETLRAALAKGSYF